MRDEIRKSMDLSVFTAFVARNVTVCIVNAISDELRNNHMVEIKTIVKCIVESDNFKTLLTEAMIEHVKDSWYRE